MPLRDLINSAAGRYGINPDVLARIVQIESGNNPAARTGSYHGLLQLSQPEFQRYNPQGDIYDPQANLNVGAQKLAGEIAQFRKTYGYEPTPTDIYLTHQQGAGGYAAHTANPAGAAWMAMASTAEGRQKGENWAKQAIWGNIPDQQKAQFGKVESVTSQDFMNLWRQKVEGPGGPPLSGPKAYGEDSPALGTPQAPQVSTPGQAPQNAPAGDSGGILGTLTRLLQGNAGAGGGGIPARAPTPYQPPQPAPLEMPPFEQLQFAGQQQPMRLAPPPRVRFGRGFY